MICVTEPLARIVLTYQCVGFVGVISVMTAALSFTVTVATKCVVRSALPPYSVNARVVIG